MRQFGAFVVENRSGAGTIIGTVEVARGAPDGYLLLLGSTNTHVLQPLTASTRSYDPLADFAPISILGTTATAIAVTPGLPVNSLQELIAYAREIPARSRLATVVPERTRFFPARCSSCLQAVSISSAFLIKEQGHRLPIFSAARFR